MFNVLWLLFVDCVSGARRKNATVVLENTDIICNKDKNSIVVLLILD